MDKKKCLLFVILTVVIGLICWVVMDLAFMDRVSAQAELPKEIAGKDGAPMVLIPAGEFEMGTDPAEIPGLMQWLEKLYLSLNLEAKASWFENESPRHTVYVDAFYMDKYEVTNARNIESLCRLPGTVSRKVQSNSSHGRMKTIAVMTSRWCM